MDGFFKRLYCINIEERKSKLLNVWFKRLKNKKVNLVNKAGDNALKKPAAEKAGDAVVNEAKKQADRLIEEAEEKGNALIEKAKNGETIE